MLRQQTLAATPVASLSDFQDATPYITDGSGPLYDIRGLFSEAWLLTLFLSPCAHDSGCKLLSS